MIVVDTNIVVALFIESARTPDAQRLFDNDPAWSTEPFTLVEFANVLATYHRAGRVTPARAATYLSHARELLQDHFLVVEPDSALKIALDFGVSAYDAHFLGVAWERGMKLTTEDARLRAAAPRLTQSLDEALKALIH
jgi:predicted nucleic acid-binding protein